MTPVMNREEALAEFAAFAPDEWGHNSVILPTELLEQIAAADLPVGVVVDVGEWRDSPWSKELSTRLTRYWNGRLIRDTDGTFWSIIRHEIVPDLWTEAIGISFYFDLLHKCLLNRRDTIEGLIVDKYEYGPPVDFYLTYRFPVSGANLKEAYDEARRIQSDLEGPAEQLLYDMTKTLARSADRILSSHHAQVSQLVSRVEAAKSPSDKGSALESLMSALFEQVPGFVVYGRDVRTETEEIDLILLNDSQDPVYSKDGPLVLVECKNWTTKMGRPDFSLLESKIRNRHSRCTVAFFVSWSGFAETTWRETIRTSRENYVIVCLTGNDVRRAALGGSFPEFLREATLHTLNR
jgi:hypothetical protein